MTNVVKKWLSVSLLSLLAFSLFGCTSSKTYPSVTNGTDDAATASEGDLTYAVSREELYLDCKKNYGLTSLLSLVDRTILMDKKNAEGVSYWDLAFTGLAKALDEAIYADSEKTTEARTAFYEKMLLYFGFDESQANEYVQLTLARRLYETDWYLANVVEGTDFTDAEYASELETLHPARIRAIILDYTSLEQLTRSLAQEDVELKNGVYLRLSTGEALTDDEIRLAFIRLYNTIHQADGSACLYQDGRDFTSTSGVIHFLATSQVGLYEQSALSALSASLPSYLMNSLADGEAAKTVKTYAGGTISLLVYRISLETTTLSEVRDEVRDSLVTAALTTSVQNQALVALRSEYSFTIADSALRTSYQETLTDVGGSYPKAKAGKNAVARTTLGVITPDDLYAVFLASYAVLELPDLMIKARNLANPLLNTVRSGSVVLDATLYTQAKNDAQDIKDAFNSGTYADAGYPKSFGWKNYLLEIYGCKDDAEFLTYCLESVIANQHKESFYLITDLKDDDSLAATYLARIASESASYFSVSFTALSLVRYDSAGSLVAQENWSEAEKTAGEEFMKGIRTYLTDSSFGLDALSRVQALVSAYASALRYPYDAVTRDDDSLSTFHGLDLAKYLSMGFILQTTTEEGYTGGAYEAIDAELKDYWEQGSGVRVSQPLTVASGLNILVETEAVDRTETRLMLADGITLADLKTFVAENASGSTSTLDSLLTSFLTTVFLPYYEERSGTYTNASVYLEIASLAWSDSPGKLADYLVLRMRNYRASLTCTSL